MRQLANILSALFLSAICLGAQAKTYFIHTDHLGTPQALTDASQTVVWKADHTPFGEATVDEDPDGDGETVTMNLRFPGQYFDEETGLHYNYFRYYDPKIGRYITSDPIGTLGGLNTYSYVFNNPITGTDPEGLICGTGACIAGVIFAIGLALDALDAVETANTLADECKSSDEKLAATGLFALGIIDPTPGNLGKRTLQGINFGGKQFAKKLNRRAQELGLDPSNAKDRFKFKSRIERIFNNAEEVRSGSFRGQSGDVLFFKRGRDVVITKKNGDFVTILTNGVNNARFKGASIIE